MTSEQLYKKAKNYLKEKYPTASLQWKNKTAYLLKKDGFWVGSGGYKGKTKNEAVIMLARSHGFENN